MLEKQEIPAGKLYKIFRNINYSKAHNKYNKKTIINEILLKNNEFDENFEENIFSNFLLKEICTKLPPVFPRNENAERTYFGAKSFGSIKQNNNMRGYYKIFRNVPSNIQIQVIAVLAGFE